MPGERLQEFDGDLCDYVVGNIRQHLNGVTERPTPEPAISPGAWNALDFPGWFSRQFTKYMPALGDHVWAGVFDEPRQVSVARALERTAAWLDARFPSGEYTWGDVHGTIFKTLYGDRLATDWVPTDGSCGTLNRADTVFFEEGGLPRNRLDSTDGSIYRMVARFRDDGVPEAFFAMGQGVSGEPTSPHWDDLRGDWVNTRYRRLRFLRAEVEADPFETITLTP